MSTPSAFPALLTAVIALGGCGGTGPTEATGPADFVLDLLGTWTYEADFRVAQPTAPADTLACAIAGGRLAVSQPITPTTYTTSSGSSYASYPYALEARFASGTLRCHGEQSSPWEVSLAGVQVTLSRALVAVAIDFVVSTPVGPMGILSGACDCFADEHETIDNGSIRGHAGATLDPQYPQFSRGRQGGMQAQKI